MPRLLRDVEGPHPLIVGDRRLLKRSGSRIGGARHAVVVNPTLLGPNPVLECADGLLG